MTVFDTVFDEIGGTASDFTAQLGGLAAFQSTSLESSISLSSFWFAGTHPSEPGAPVHKIGHTFEDVYQTGTGFNARKFVYSSSLNLNIVTPAANLVGTYFKGKIPVNSLIQAGGATIQELIRIADETHVQQPRFELNAAFHNDILGSITPVQNTILTNESTLLGGELVHYIVLQNSAQSITDSANKSYTLMGTIQGNFGFYPDPTDAFLYNMFKINPYRLGTSLLSDVPFSPLRVKARMPLTRKEIPDFINDLAITAGGVGQIEDNGMQVASNTLLEAEENKD